MANIQAGTGPCRGGREGVDFLAAPRWSMVMIASDRGKDPVDGQLGKHDHVGAGLPGLFHGVERAFEVFVAVGGAVVLDESEAHAWSEK